mmetsp:Transcript_53820/g.169332  ORF Transcript_53820/g.169332 Transcript_53820/m.169332 type:complete len:239 (-) Transcript_53820:742-1458(-)
MNSLLLFSATHVSKTLCMGRWPSRATKSAEYSRTSIEDGSNVTFVRQASVVVMAGACAARSGSATSPVTFMPSMRSNSVSSRMPRRWSWSSCPSPILKTWKISTLTLLFRVSRTFTWKTSASVWFAAQSLAMYSLKSRTSSSLASRLSNGMPAREWRGPCSSIVDSCVLLPTIRRSLSSSTTASPIVDRSAMTAEVSRLALFASISRRIRALAAVFMAYRIIFELMKPTSSATAKVLV